MSGLMDTMEEVNPSWDLPNDLSPDIVTITVEGDELHIKMSIKLDITTSLAVIAELGVAPDLPKTFAMMVAERMSLDLCLDYIPIIRYKLTRFFGGADYDKIKKG